MELPSLALEKRVEVPPTRTDVLTQYSQFMVQMGRPSPPEYGRAITHPPILQPSAEQSSYQSTGQSVLYRPRSEEWEFYKPIIKRLYMDENLNLSEVIKIMKAKYSLNATSRMYKRRFQEWGFRKFNTKLSRAAAPGGKVEHQQNHNTACRKPSRRPLDDVSADHWRGLQGTNELHSYIARISSPRSDALLEIGLIGIRNYLLNHSELHKAAWDRASQFEIIVTDNNFTLVYNLVSASLGFFAAGDYGNWGILMRSAFQRIEKNIKSANPGLVAEVVIHTPYLLMRHAPREMLNHWVGYLACFSRIALPGHPLHHVTTALFSIAKNGEMGDYADMFHNYISIISTLWADIYTGIRGPTDRNSLNARSEQLLISSSYNQESMAKKYLAQCRDLRSQAAETLGVLHINSLELEGKALEIQSFASYYSSDFIVEYQTLLRHLDQLRSTSPKEGEETLSYECLRVYRRLHRGIGRYWYSRGDYEVAAESLERGLEYEPKEIGEIVFALNVLDDLEPCYTALDRPDSLNHVNARRNEFRSLVSRM